MGHKQAEVKLRTVQPKCCSPHYVVCCKYCYTEHLIFTILIQTQPHKKLDKVIYFHIPRPKRTTCKEVVN